MNRFVLTDVKILGIYLTPDDDPVTEVALETKADKIHVGGAKKYQNYVEFDSKIVEILTKNSFDYCMIESNWKGNKLAEKIQGCVYVGAGILCDSKNNSDHLVTNKSVVQFVEYLRNNNALTFPGNPSPDMKEFEKQFSVYSELIGPDGKIFYGPKQKNQDNFVRAFLLACIDAMKHVSS